MSMYRVLTLALVSMVESGCIVDDRGLDPECRVDAEALEIEVVARDGGDPIVGDLVVEGSASHSGDMAIHSVVVAGKHASKDGFNFSEWSVILPFELLQELEPDASGKVALAAEVRDTCGNVKIDEETMVTVDPFAGVEVTSLSLSVDYMEGVDFVPTEVLQGATLTVSADPSGERGVVELEGEGVVFDGLPKMAVTLGTGAQKTVVVTAADAGTFTIVATSEQAPSRQPVTALLRAVGPTKMLPAALSVSPGQQSAAISVVADGTKPTCEANLAAGLGATLSGQDLVAAPVQMGADDATISIQVDAGATEQSVMKITCVDDYGQPSSATVALVP